MRPLNSPPVITKPTLNQLRHTLKHTQPPYSVNTPFHPPITTKSGSLNVLNRGNDVVNAINDPP